MYQFIYQKTVLDPKNTLYTRNVHPSYDAAPFNLYLSLYFIHKLSVHEINITSFLMSIDAVINQSESPSVSQSDIRQFVSQTEGHTERQSVSQSVSESVSEPASSSVCQ